MHLVLELLAGFGPAVLTAIGLAASLVRPSRRLEGNWIWPAAILLAGIPVSVAAFLLIYETREPQVVAANAPAASAPLTLETLRIYRLQHLHAGLHHGLHHGYAYRPIAPATIASLTTQHQIAQIPPLPAAASNRPQRIPSNTLSCMGFTKNSDGSWSAGHATQPFDVGNDKSITIRDQGPIVADWVDVGGVDLYALLNSKCGK